MFLVVVNKREAFGCGYPGYEAEAREIRGLDNFGWPGLQLTTAVELSCARCLGRMPSLSQWILLGWERRVSIL